MWGEPTLLRNKIRLQNISTHSPRVGRTNALSLTFASYINFNSLAPCGANLSRGVSEHRVRVNFNSLAPCGANHATPEMSEDAEEFQLTRPVWGEPGRGSCKFGYLHISTHSPRVGRTIVSIRCTLYYEDFNSLAPCGANLSYTQSISSILAFQLTRPVWGEPGAWAQRNSTHPFQLTRPVWGEPIDD